MRSSTIIALAAVAAASPAFAAPVATSTGNFARADTNSPSTSTDVSSEALSLGTISTIASFAAPLIGGVINHFKNNGNQKQRRDALELESLLARAEASGDESDAISLGTISTIASFAAPVVGGIIDHFRNKDKRSELEELFARAAAEDDSSEAIKLGTVANVASIGSSLVSAFQGLFGREDAMELLARASEDDISGALFDGLRHNYVPGRYHVMRDDAGEDSEAIKLGTVANVASIGSSIVSAFHSLFGREDTMELLARASEDDVSAALSTLLRSGPQLYTPIMPGPIRATRRPVYNVARDDAPADQDSEAIKLGTVANIASIGSSLVSAFQGLWSREDGMGLLARADFSDDDSAAIVLRPGMQPIRIPSSLNGFNFRIGRADAEAESAALFLHGLRKLGSLGPVHLGIKRDVLEFLARAETTDESDAIKLSTLGNIASIGGSIISAVHNLFSSNSKREFNELLARVDQDSEAIKLSTLGNIASIGGSVISAIHNLFSSNNQGQKREFMELLSRAAAADSFQARSLNELD